MLLTNYPRAIGAFLLATVAATAPAAAQELTIGNKAPSLSVEEWLKGTPVTAFQPGETYVVEFWATWCAPCLASIPHLSGLQKEYKDSKVTFLGIAASERAKTPEEAHEKLVKFIADRGDGMAYTVGYDSNRSMSKDWMEAAEQKGIPAAFVVDGTGTIAWIGHPMELDKPLAEIVAGKWDIKAEAAKAKAKAELMAKLEPVQEKAGAATQAGNWDEALAALEEGIAMGEQAEQQLALWKCYVLLQQKNSVGAYAYADKLCKGVLKDDAVNLAQLASMMIDPELIGGIEKKSYDAPLACALRACELMKGKADEAACLATLAAVYSAKGDNAKAIETQTRAVALMKDKEGAEEYVQKLETYKQASAKG